MHAVAREEGRPQRRPSFLRALGAAALVVLLAAPALLHFASGRGLAGVGDDSVSYLQLARFFAGNDGTLLRPWIGHASHFPPLFPLVLALFGASADFALAHLVVAGFAVAALVMVQRYGALRLGGQAAGFALAAAFLLVPGAWLNARAILTEPMYLFVSLLALDFHGRRLERGPASAGAWLAFGVLVAAAVLTRAAGVTLVVAMLARAGWLWAARRERPRWAGLLLAVAPVAVLEALWVAVRPGGPSDAYAQLAGSMAQSWMREPLLMLHTAGVSIVRGWIATFAGESRIAPVAAAVFAALGVVALYGSVRAALEHRLDGWYALAFVALAFGWVFGEDASQRLLYPIVPLLLLHAAQAIVALARRAGRPGRWIAVAAFALPALLCLPAIALVQQKSLDREPVFPFSPQGDAEMSDYYTVLNVPRAKALAARDIAVLGGLSSLDRLTPAGARVMWMRPEYVAMLGRREGVPFYYAWDARRLASEIRRSHVDYVVYAARFKSDLHGVAGDPAATLRGIGDYTRATFAARNPIVGGNDFLLLQVDPAALDRYLAAPGG